MQSRRVAQGDRADRYHLFSSFVGVANGLP